MKLIERDGEQRHADSDIVETPLDRAVKGLRPVLRWCMAIGFVLTLLHFVSALFVIQVHERVVHSRNETTLLLLLAITLFAILFQCILDAIRSNILRRAAVQFDRAIASDAFDAIQNVIVKRPLDKTVASLRDVGELRDFISGSAMSALMDAFWFPIFIIVLFIIHPIFAVIAIVTGVLVGVLTILTSRSTKAASKEASKAESIATQRATTAFQNYETIHSMGMRAPLRRKWLEAHEAALGWSIAADDRSTLLRIISSFVRGVSYIVTFSVATLLVLHRELVVGHIFAVSLIMGLATSPLQRVIVQWKTIMSTREARDRLQALFNDVAAERKKMGLPKPRGAISIESLLVTPPGKGIESLILRNINLAIPAGSVLALIGPSGCGKSSLLRILLGVWRPLSGEVRVDGTKIEDWNDDELSQWIGYLPQNVELFPGSIEENIARFTDASHEDVIAAAELAGVHDMIQRLPQGYNTEVGEHGKLLAGGQRQRVGLARALFGEPSIIILDEPNSSLDAVGEERLIEAISTLKAAGKTVIFVTHKVSLVSVATHVAVLGNGTLTNFGPRTEVMQRIAQPRVVLTKQGATG